MDDNTQDRLAGKNPQTPATEAQGTATDTVVQDETPSISKGESIIYKVVVNHEDQYSIWPARRDNPRGWRDVGKTGTKEECLAYIKEVWVDMRPRSLREKMERMEKSGGVRAKAAEPPRPPDPRDDLVGFLSRGEHPAEIVLRPDRTVKAFQEALGRGFVHVKFTDTRGGTELGMRVDTAASNLSADFGQEKGSVHLEGNLSLNSVKIRCIADIDVASLRGTGHIRPRAEEEIERKPCAAQA